jgi:hypothetical protein
MPEIPNEDFVSARRLLETTRNVGDRADSRQKVPGLTRPTRGNADPGTQERSEIHPDPSINRSYPNLPQKRIHDRR